MIPKSPFAAPFAGLSFLVSTSTFAAEPKEVVALFHAALAGGDKVKVVELMAPGVAIYESGYVEASREGYANHHLGDDIACAKATTRKMLKRSERMEGNLAVVWLIAQRTKLASYYQRVHRLTIAHAGSF